MKKKIVQAISIIILFIAAWVLYHEFRHYHFHDILRQIESIPAWQISLAAFLTLLSYGILIGYDTMAVRYVGRSLRLNQIAPASFIGYAFSNNIANPFVSGAVRYRLYSALGLTAIEIGQLIVFCGFSLWLGFFFLGGAIFLVKPVGFSGVPLSLTAIRLVGLLLLSLSLIYLASAIVHKKRIKIGRWSFALPSWRLAVAQLVIASADWMMSASVLYILFLHHSPVSFMEFISAFMLAQIVGMLSQVPAGIGVFETLMVLFFKPVLSADAVLGVLVIYRFLYYLCPLLLAALSLAILEVKQRRAAIRQAVKTYSKWVSPIVPNVFALTTFIGGIILLFSGATPAVHNRLLLLFRFIPLPIIELSHFIASLAGGGLLLLARGLQRRLDGAFYLTIILLAVSIVVSLLKGIDYEEAILLSIMLIALWSCRSEFYRKASYIEQRFTFGWYMAIAIVVASSVWLGFFAHKHVQYSNNLWWQFALQGDASRSLRASIGVISLIGFYALFRLVRSGPPQKIVPPTAESMEIVDSLVHSSPQSYAYLAFLGDKNFLFSSTKKSFIMYGISGRSWIAMGDPIGEKDEHEELVWRFREICNRHGGWPIIYEINQLQLPMYINQGFTFLKLGEDARVPLSTFSIEGSHYKTVRHNVHKLESEGLQFDIVPPAQVSYIMAKLQIISDDWLKRKNTNEKRFSLGYFYPDYLIKTPVAIIRKNEHIVAFANMWCSGQLEELSIDLMRYSSAAPSGIMDYLFVKLMLWGKEQGYRWFDLGMAPFAGIESRENAPLWNRLSSLVFRYGEHFYNFQGLRQYKDKFEPEWEPKYMASPGGVALPIIFANIAALTSHGLRGVVSRTRRK
jgi:phosphatidylglycerol lysyltransferase